MSYLTTDSEAIDRLRFEVELDHRLVGAHERLLAVGEHVVDEKRAVPDAPERLALVQALDQLALGRGQPQQLAGQRRLLGVLVVDDRRRGVNQAATKSRETSMECK